MLSTRLVPAIIMKNIRNFDDIYISKIDIIHLINRYPIIDIVPIKKELHSFKKIPIWVYWHQGLESAPELVQMCVKSIKKNIPSNAEFVFLTKDNLFKYIELPNYILEKIKTNYTHLSGIIRAALLYLYGGMWIDATYLVTREIPKEYFEKDFWAIKTEVTSQRLKIPSNFNIFTYNLMYSKPNNEMLLYIYKMLCNYWFYYHYLKHYFLKDGIILYGYENFQFPREYIDSLPYTNPDLYVYTANLNDKFEKDKFENYIKDTVFFKLTYKLFYLKEQNEDKELTNYGYFKTLF